MATADERHLEGARTQSLFREVNERIDEIGEQTTEDDLLCECANKECVETIVLTLGEYESVRRVPTHFFVAPGHDVPEIERVVERNERYVVVEKFGDAGIAAVRLDPRRRSPEHSEPHE